MSFYDKNRYKMFFLVFFTLLFLINPDSKSASIENYCATPPFITSQVTPNVLIILDNSNSMDEDFYGNAVGSYSPSSKSVVARESLRNIIDNLKDKLRIGLMTYKLPNRISYQYIHNSPYFVSYEPKSYCPHHSKVCSDNTSKTCESDDDCSGGSCVDPCVKYCQTGESDYGNICESQCQAGNSLFDKDYFDEIITNYSVGSEQRNRYCNLVYPKIQRMMNPTDTSHYIYYKHAYPFYSNYNQGTAFAYSKTYNPNEGTPWDKYWVYGIKTGTSDGFSVYRNFQWAGQIYPTDSDIALGYKDFGRRLSWYYVGPTWFSNSSPGDGYLHVPVGNLEDSDGDTTSTYDDLWDILNPNKNNVSGYMSCRRSNKNSCPYIINAGLTPTGGTFQTAINYFENSNSPIQVRCQRNFIVYVTDGLPSVDENGNKGTADSLMPDVISKIDALRNIHRTINGKTYNFDIKTYVLGVGLSDEAKSKLDIMAEHGGTTDEKGHAYYANNPGELTNAINRIFRDILKRVSSNTAPTIMATNEKSGSIILQALFYPQKTFDNSTKAKWTGSLKSMWFYLGPFAQNIREDTDENKILNLFNDYAVSFFFDNSTQTARVHVMKDSNGDGIPDTSLPDKNVSEVKYLWDAGMSLWETSPDDRKIFTDVDNLTDNSTEGNFTSVNASKLMSYLDVDNLTRANNVINYIRGEEIEGYRKRTITIGTNSHVWKLGDIIDSTPQILSGAPLNDYYKNAPYGYNDKTYKEFVESDDYKNRGMVFVGANDGMLHAFRLGKVTMLNPIHGDIAKLEKQPADAELGSEAWGFIPKNLLPYLKYYMDKEYCHIYYVDLTPYVFDASMGDPEEHINDYYSQTKTENSWRTILIGGLNLGGACGNGADGAVHPPNDTGKVPSGIGRSSYFALDVTDPENPKVLWEFSDNDLGFTTTGPAIVHIPVKKQLDNGTYVDDNKKNGYWYVVFASGPDNYNGTVHQPMYLYILDLKTGDLKRKIQLSGSGKLLGDIDAFAGRMFESNVDLGTNYSDDSVYFGYTYKGNSWDGGVLRLVTNDDVNPDNWQVSKLIDGIGPVTSGVRTLQDKQNNALWVYFGEGRYFTKEDDPTAQRRIYGVKDPCFGNGVYIKNCASTLNLNDLTNVTEDANASIDNNGWYIKLAESSLNNDSERIISSPVASTNGWVFYTSFIPTSDVCGFGGSSDIWMVNYNNGGTPQGVEGSLYVQFSTGTIKNIKLKQEFGQGHSSSNNSFGRRLKVKFRNAGKPTIISPPPPINKVIQWKEK